ncbi:7526_t:CDS:1 [Funneliformis geosporum]|uniref:7673_t:CDS:1 n=1 Tax=Funneliformis geosporum TaxID=1117311 RepID=A0A9W4WV06_9GLOM|nr:7526_t:CDS:1 [Funneliformis geosporum]CAI2174168.1 7673_t:CDS:1 [Funneliformis geosporum]
MGLTKSLRYEVLVYSKTKSSPDNEQQHQQTTSPLMADDNSSSTNSAATALFETRVQRFPCDRENMQQYWIPEGFHPILVPRTYLTTNSLVATSNFSRQLMNTERTNLLSGNGHQLHSINDINDIELRRRRNLNLNNPSSSCANNGGIMKKKRRNLNMNVNALNLNRRTVLGHSTPTVNINTAINRQKIKERISAIRNAAVTITSSSSLKNNNNNISSDCNYITPSIKIGEMWKNEPENIKKHYERLAIRKKFAQALAFEQKISSSSCGKPNSKSIPSSNVLNTRQHHVNQTTPPGSSYRLPVHSNAVEGVNAVYCSSSPSSSSIDNTDVHINNHQDVDNSLIGHRYEKANSTPSSPISSFKHGNRPISDWMTHPEREVYDENSSEYTDNNSTIAY